MTLKRKFTSLAALAALALAGCSKPPELHIYTWCDYIAPDVLAEFEQANNC